MGQVRPSEPTPIRNEHQLDHFTCGVETLDDWLQRRARSNQLSGASRTYVAADGMRVVAYYCLAAGALSVADAPGPVRRNMPDPIPIAVLGRLAVDRSHHGKKLGAALLLDATERTMEAAAIIGIRGLLVHANSDSARDFYLHHGFIDSPNAPRTLILALKGHS